MRFETEKSDKDIRLVSLQSGTHGEVNIVVDDAIVAWLNDAGQIVVDKDVLEMEGIVLVIEEE